MRNFRFLVQMVQRALSEIRDVGDGTAELEAMADASTVRQGTTPSTHFSDRQNSPHELNLDGMVLRQAIWLAAVIDSKHVSLDVLVACLVVTVSLWCAFAGVFCWRWARSRGRSGKTGKGGGTAVRVHGMPQRISEKRAKTA